MHLTSIQEMVISCVGEMSGHVPLNGTQWTQGDIMSCKGHLDEDKLIVACC